MENLILSANIVAPMFIVMALGYIARLCKVLEKNTVIKMNNVAFRIFIPIMVFNNIRTADTSVHISVNVFLFVFLGILAVFFLCMLFIPIIEKENTKRSVMIQGIVRGNYVLFGIPMVQAIYKGSDAVIASLVVVVAVPLFNALSVIALEMYRGGKTNVWKIVKGILTNPLIIGSALGFLFLKLQISFPQLIEKPIADLSAVATPLALFLLGSSFEFSKVGKNLRQLSVGVFCKLVLSPLIMTTLAVLLGFRGPELACIMVVFGAPTAINSYTMAQQMDADADLAAQQVVFSSGLSIITIFFMVFIGLQSGVL